MKPTTVLALVAAATLVSAETNANRMARGLPPNAPAKRATAVSRARRTSPSGTPGGSCNTGAIQCCNSVTSAGSGGIVDELLGLLNVPVSAGTPVGVSCSPITAVGGGSGADCQQQPVCCSDNSYNGLINIGCSPININL